DRCFPLAQCVSILGTYSLLLLFTAFFLPRSSIYLGIELPEPRTSLDRPQAEFLKPLTSKPALTITWMVLGAAMVAMWWSGWVRAWWLSERGATTEDTEQRVREKLASMRNAWMVTIGMVPIMMLALILFGAPIASHVVETLSLSLLLSLLITFAPVYTLPLPHVTIYNPPSPGRPGTTFDAASAANKLIWVRLFSELKTGLPSERFIVYPIIGVLVGAWLAAIPLALDWDRPWQAWPLLPAYGAVLGNISGALCALIQTSLEAL
ncbi:GPI biosynthesis protein family Pig-F-domain-containing protein, partial [Cantharellus anzutake]|uniref:GPI biosynthesis protein family Pig-F-domain-containing protein n=1 Tax=Cantharellus anzutake TaxID=1750568 RepID=UPI00190334EA